MPSFDKFVGLENSLKIHQLIKCSTHEDKLKPSSKND